MSRSLKSEVGKIQSKNEVVEGLMAEKKEGDLGLSLPRLGIVFPDSGPIRIVLMRLQVMTNKISDDKCHLSVFSCDSFLFWLRNRHLIEFC